MAADSGIEWTDHTFNPWWGCVKVSRACKRCYAETLAKRYGFDVWGPGKRRRFFGEAHWGDLMRWNRAAEKAGKPARVFVASMADLFEELPGGHEDRQAMADARARLFAAVPNLTWLRFLMLTKRPENILGMVPREWRRSGWWPENAWPGATVEGAEGLDRLDALGEVRSAPGRFVSYEPAVGPVDWYAGIERGKVDWLIAGGESGGGAEAASADWFREARDAALEREVPFFFKQWGEHLDEGQCGADGIIPLSMLGPVRVGKKKAGAFLDGVRWVDVPRPLVCA